MTDQADRNAATVTLKHVAERAGLSVATASLALSGSPRIPDVTRERVRSAAEILGYTPNGAARALRSKRHGAIGLFVFDPGSALGLSFYSEAVLAVADEALRQDLAVTLVNAWPHTRNGLSQAVLSARVDAAVCIGGGFTVEDAQQLERRGLPYIFVGKRELPGVQVPYVSTNYLEGARLATTHLLELGHKRVAVGVRPGDLARPWIRDRVAGHSLAIRDAGLPESAGPLIELSDDVVDLQDTPDVAHRPEWDARRWLDDGVTSIFVTDHGPAGRLLRSLRLQGIEVPRQVAVVGFDDPPGTDLLLPPLTVVRQPLAALGAAAARTVIAWLGGAPREPQATMLEPSLVVRHSCGAHLRLNGHSRN